MILWRNIEFFSLFIILIPTSDFPHFYYMLGGNLGSLLYGDVSVMQSMHALPTQWVHHHWFFLGRMTHTISLENLYSGSPTWSDTHRVVQLQKMARGLKFKNEEVEGFYLL